MSSELSAILGNQASSSNLPPQPPVGRYRWFALAVLVLVSLFAALTWRRWIPATTVSVVRVDTVPADGLVATSGQVAFQAAGWIEADPYLVEASALIDGIVAEVLVFAGQHVEQGAVLTRLIDDEQRLELAAAEAAVQRSVAARQQAEARMAEVEAERARLPARLAAATAERDERGDRAQRLNESGAAVALGTQKQAELQAASAQHHLTDLDGSRAVLDAGLAATRADVAERRAGVTAAEVTVAQAKLALERTVIRAPRSGIIQRLHVRPGAKLMLAGDHHNSATVAELYDPARLQIRVDVALADVARLAVGQRARITCEALGQRELDGTVIRLDGMADVARNTLQAKVALAVSDPVLRPEMLCRVQFLSASGGGPSGVGALRLVRLLLPVSLVGGVSDGEHQLWTVDHENRAQRVRVRLGGKRGELIEVLDGLTAGAWVIRDPPSGLVVGERVNAKELP